MSFSLKFCFRLSEEKCEQIESLKDEIDEVRKQFNKLRNENVELQQKAALANVYSDELESLREKVSGHFVQNLKNRFKGL